MACHELSALRIAIGRLLEKEEHDLEHEREELAPVLGVRRELSRLVEAKSFPALRRGLEEALAHLEGRLSEGGAYDRGLALATEAALQRVRALERELEGFYADLDLLHRRLHRLFPRRKEASKEER